MRVGPGAANLEGARLGAERIVWGLKDVLKEWDVGGPNASDEIGEKGGEQRLKREIRYASGIGSRFESLEVEN